MPNFKHPFRAIADHTEGRWRPAQIRFARRHDAPTAAEIAQGVVTIYSSYSERFISRCSIAMQLTNSHICSTSGDSPGGWRQC